MLASSDTSRCHTGITGNVRRQTELTTGQLTIRDGKIICHIASTCRGHGRDEPAEMRIIILIDFAFCGGRRIIVESVVSECGFCQVLVLH